MDFDQFIEAVKQQMQPAGRAQHLAATLQELLAIIPDEVTLADLTAEWQLLARPKSQNEAADLIIAQQRTTIYRYPVVRRPILEIALMF
ncbi:MAG TPA: hypothetical protein VH186_03710 [Chloroflexia bacterium]|nr:hypothetical protein [Chloroflexia bacterium]